MQQVIAALGLPLPSQRFIRSPETVLLGQQKSPRAHLAHSIKILTWNIAKLTQHRHWQREFATLLTRHQPDLILLQEVWVCAQTKHLSSLTEIPWHFAPNFLDAHHNHYSGVLTATQAHCLASRSVLTEHHEPIAQTPKVALFTEFALPHQAHSLLAVNAHLINFVDLGRFRAQLAQIEAVMQQHQGAIVFAGDFNTWHRSRWEELLQMTRGLGLSPVPFAGHEAQKIKRFLNSPPLDYVFSRGFQLQPLSAKVIATTQSSDHKPLIVELAVAAPTAAITPPAKLV
jgi:endonuclease/exonuclease/phosphatase (EEP) superfamily protein YafD